MSRMRRTLSVLTSLGPAINYTLQATIPGHMLTKCAAALPRPPWEPILYYSTICIMAFLLFCILVASYFEADRIFTADILRRRAKINSSQLFDKSRVFDLKTIAGIKQTPSVDKQQSGGKTPPTAPPVEMSNGHVEFPKKKSSTWSPLELFKRLFGRSTTETYTSSSNSDSSKTAKTTYLPVHNNSSSNNRPIKTGPPPSPETIEVAAAVSANAPPDKNYYKNNKKARAIKRQHSDLLNEVGAPESSRKLDSTLTNVVGNGREDKPSYHTKTADNSNKTSRNKDLQDSDEPVKNNRRAKRTKSPNIPEQDATTKEKLRHSSELFPDEKDDTSSTTTDSSIPDPETSSARESTPEPQPLSKKAKTKKDKKKMDQGMDDDDAGEDEFVITSKSKAHKKIRVDRKSAYGGNIHCPSSLELPYKTKLEAQKENERNNAVNAGQDKIRKVLKNRASKVKTSDMRSRTNSEASDRSTESPPPVWDMPVSQGDLSDLSSQTEQFASRLTNNKIPTGALRGPSPDSVSSGSSYSSVVSNGSTQQTPDLSRVKYLGLDDTKKTTNSPLNMTDKHPGAIGSKAWAATSGISSTWLGAAGKDTLASGYGLHGIGEGQLSPTTPEMPSSFNNLGTTSDNMMPYMYSGFSSPQPPTFMQKLQADRRKRLMDYQQKVINGEDWPGLSLNIQPDSLWSQTMTNHGSDASSAWPLRSDSPPKPEVTKGLWDIPQMRTSPNWPSGGSIWSTAPSAAAAPVPVPVTEDLGCTDAGPSVIADLPGSPASAAATMPAFNPFNTSIWQPGIDGGINRWSFSPSPLEDDPM